MKQKTKKYFLFFSVMVFVIAAMLFYGLWNKPHEDIKSAEALKTDAITLYRSLSLDSNSAKTNFINKVLEVSGTIKLITHNLRQEQVVLLETNDETGAVNCTMEKNLVGMKAGNKIWIKGICIGYSGGDSSLGLPGDVFLVRCYPVF